jgi:hypothetical protein
MLLLAIGLAASVVLMASKGLEQATWHGLFC